MDSFVFTRHSSDCKFKRDRFCNRCNCPKWVEGRFNHERFRKSASTRVWDEAEQFREKLEEALSRGLPLGGLHPDSITAPAAPPSPLHVPAAQPPSPATASVPISPGPAAAPSEVNAPSPSQSGTQSTGRQKARATVQKAVDAYMTDARSRGLKSDTIKKLERIFEKQFLPWTRVQGLEFLDEVDLDALLAFRSTWTEGAIVRAKKQDRVIGFFWDCFRRNYLTQNPALSLSKIKTTPVPTDYFPRDEFERIIASTEAYGDARGGFIPIRDTRTRLRTLTLLMRWSGLRIRDAVTLERHRLHGDTLRIAAGLLLAVLLSVVGYQVFRRLHSHGPEALLERADEMSWLNSWIAAEPLYRKAEIEFEQRHQPSKALYARVSQMPAQSESSASFPSQIALLRHDLDLPEAREPETRLTESGGSSRTFTRAVPRQSPALNPEISCSASMEATLCRPSTQSSRCPAHVPGKWRDRRSGSSLTSLRRIGITLRGLATALRTSTSR